jgi:hypothetical protein
MELGSSQGYRLQLTQRFHTYRRQHHIRVACSNETKQYMRWKGGMRRKGCHKTTAVLPSDNKVDL